MGKIILVSDNSYTMKKFFLVCSLNLHLHSSTHLQSDQGTVAADHVSHCHRPSVVTCFWAASTQSWQCHTHPRTTHTHCQCKWDVWVGVVCGTIKAEIRLGQGHAETGLGTDSSINSTDILGSSLGSAHTRTHTLGFTWIFASQHKGWYSSN